MAEIVVILPLNQVRRLQEINPREGHLNLGVVYSMMKNLDNTPPMIAYRMPSGELFLASGFHRFKAHEKAMRTEGRFIIRNGDLTEAQDCAVIDNLGPRGLTRVERQRAIENFIERHPDYADNKIAEILHTYPRLVARLRERLERERAISRYRHRKGIDGNLHVILTPEEILERSPRKKRTLNERLTPCAYCNYPISETHHPFAVSKFGGEDDGNDVVLRVCSNCHRLCEIVKDSLEDLEYHGYSQAHLLLRRFVREWGGENELLHKIGNDVVDVWADERNDPLEKGRQRFANLLRRLGGMTK